MHKFACSPVRQRCRRGIKMRAIVPGESVTLARIAVNAALSLTD